MDQAYDQAASAKVADQYFPGLYPEYVKDYHVFTDANNPDNDKLSAIASMYVNDLEPSGTLAPTSETFYKADALDSSPAITGANAISTSVYVPRYQSSWTDINDGFNTDCTSATTAPTCATKADGTFYNAYTHQMRWRNPPSDSYITSDTYHVPNSNMVLVLWDNGSARKVDPSIFLSGAAAEAPTDVSASGGVSGVNFWKLNPTGP